MTNNCSGLTTTIIWIQSSEQLHPVSLLSHLPPPQPLAINHRSVFVPVVLRIPECHINGITWYVVSESGFSRLAYHICDLSVLLCLSGVCSFLPLRDIPAYGCTMVVCLLNIEGHLCHFQFLAVINKVTVNIHIKDFMLI